jgi:hypothetical protein
MSPEALDNQMLARGLGSVDLAKITRLDISTITSARRGHRVSRRTVLLIVDALDKVPIRPTVATLIGLDAPVVENGEKKATDGVKSRRSKEVPRAGGRSRQTA